MMIKPTMKLAALLSAWFCMNAAAVNNPVSYNTDITDCDVIKYNGEYYITGNWLAGDMLRSRDLESWGEQRHIFSWNNSWHTAENNPQDLDIHAGHIRYINGTFHFYTQLGTEITHATSSNIWGPYTEPVDANFAGQIDAETFLDDDGSLYFYSTRFNAGNQNYVRPMSDPSTFSAGYSFQISGTPGWENNTVINEGPKVIKYRGKYYMLYNAYETSDPNYSIGCVEASSPTGFNNSLKYTAPICTRITPPGADEIAYVGQAWVVDGLNGFEKWLGYFAQNASDGRTQRIDRMHFFDRHLFVDGPTDRHTLGYHPGPAKPQLLNIFPIADGAMPTEDWTEQTAGTWAVANEEAIQSDQAAWTLNTANRESAVNYLIEANLKFTEAQDAEDKVGVIAYYEDANNFVIVGLDRSTGYGADGWYAHVKEAGADTIYSGGYGGSVDYEVYHKIRVTKNSGNFDIRIDDMIPPGHTTITTSFSGLGIPGLYTDHAAAAFDGVIYTIGWDEFDADITGWGNALSGISELGSWSIGANGITMATGTGYTFKGDLMPEYEFATQVYKEGATDGSMGVFAVGVDGNNYVTAVIDLATDELVVNGFKAGVALVEQRVGVANKTDYNLRVAKLSDRVIFFVDGVEILTLNEAYGAAQVGLYSIGMSARFNGIMTYRTESDFLPAPWGKSDIGPVGFPGTADSFDNAFYMTGSGSDIWGTSDEFTFVHADANGDWEISTRVVNIDESSFWSKAALMFRNDLAGNSARVLVCATGTDNGVGRAQLIWRDAAGAASGGLDGVDQNLSYPFWIKLKREGGNFTGLYSSDGQNWTTIGTVTPPLSSGGKLGFGVTAQNNDRIATAVFDHINIDAVPADVAVGDFTAFDAPFRLYASGFFSPQGYEFAGSQWQISTSTDFSAPKWDSGVAAPQNYVAVPAGIAVAGDYGSVRYQDDQGAWSDWSEAYLLSYANHTIAHWRFEDGTAGVAHAGDQDNWYLDVSGNGNHLSSFLAGARPTATADLSFTTVPQIGAQNTLALDFIPNNDLGTFGAQTGGKMIETYMFNSGWTIEATFKLRALYWEVIVGKDGKRALGPEAPVWLKILNFNKHLELLFLDNADDFKVVQSLSPLESNTWYSVAITYDNNEAKMYLKGAADADYVYQGSVSAPAGATLGQYAQPWTVGRGMHNGAPVDFINGVVDEVRISDIPLNPESFIGAAVVAGYDFDVDGMADEWELQYFNSISNGIPLGDPDGDGLEIFSEYALGGNPTNGLDTGYPITFEPDGVSGFNYVYPRRTSPAGLVYHLETTDDLFDGAWTNGGYVVWPVAGTLDSEFEAVTNAVPIDGAAQKFIRLIIE